MPDLPSAPAPATRAHSLLVAATAVGAVAAVYGTTRAADVAPLPFAVCAVAVGLASRSGFAAGIAATVGSAPFLASWYDALGMRDLALVLASFGAHGVVAGLLGGAARGTPGRRGAGADPPLAAASFHAAVEGAPNAMLVIDPEGRVVLSNGEAERLLGYSRDQLRGLGVDALVPDGARAAHAGQRGRFLADARKRPMGAGRDLRARCRDGREVPVEIGLSPFRTAAGVYTIAGVVDLTERQRQGREVQDALAREQAQRLEAELAVQRLRQLQTVTDAALAHLSHVNVLDELLARIHALLGVDSAGIMLVGDDGETLVARAARGVAQDAHDMRVAMGQGFAGRVAVERRPVVVEELDVEDGVPALQAAGLRSLLGVPLVVQGGVRGVLHVGTVERRRFSEQEIRLLQLVGDRVALVLEQLRLIEAERGARSEAEAANRAKDEFLAVVSHELRTPLNPIAGWTHLIRDGALGPADIGTALDGIDRNARALARLIDDLLDASRLATGKVQLRLEPLAVAAVVTEALHAVQSAALAKRVMLESRIAAADAVVQGDPDRLRQIVWNLASNAIKFTPPGGRVEVRVERALDRVELRVSDTGAGIPAAALPRVFERFWQADASFSRTHGGLGLGLAVVRHLVELHGGDVRAESGGEGRGATFVVSLPASAARVAPALALSGHAPEISSALRGRRILLVDDESDSLEVVRALFVRHGAEVRTAQSVAEARAVLADWPPDLLVSDLAMPMEDGFTLIREVRLREASGLPRLPAVALTAFSRDEDRRRAVAAGFDAHVAKPVESADLLGLMSRLASTARH